MTSSHNIKGEWLHIWELLEPSFDYLATRDGWPELLRRLGTLCVHGNGKGPEVELEPSSADKYTDIMVQKGKNSKFNDFVTKQAKNTALHKLMLRYYPMVMSQRHDYGVFAKVKMLMTCLSKGAYYKPIKAEEKPYENPQCTCE